MPNEKMCDENPREELTSDPNLDPNLDEIYDLRPFHHNQAEMVG